MNEPISSTRSPEQSIADNQPGSRNLGLAPSVAQPARLRAWWQSAWATRVALLVIVLCGAYFRFLGLLTWDSGAFLHPDERFYTEVATSVRTPESLSEYFDAARSPANPRNVGKGFFVYGSFPVTLTRLVAVMLTPDEALPATVPNIGQRPDPDGDGEIPNPELAIPKIEPLQRLFNSEGLNMTTYNNIQLVGRSIVVLFDLGSIVLVFLIGARLYDRRVGLLAALLSALAVMSIQQSHFFVDPIFSTFFALFTLYWAVRVAQGGGVWSYALMGVGLGCAVASRITLVGMVVPVVVAAGVAVLVWRDRRRATQTPDTDEAASLEEVQPAASFGLVGHVLQRVLPLLILAAALSLLTFRVLHPYVFVGSTPDSPALVSSMGEELSTAHPLHGMGFFDVRLSPRFLENMTSIRLQVTGVADIPPSQQWVNRTAYLFPWQNMVLWGMGPALGLTVWVGWLVAGWWLLRRGLALARGTVAARVLVPLVLWVWVGFYFGWQGGQFASTMRYMLPIYGALIIFGAWLLLKLWDRSWMAARQDTGSRWRRLRRWRPVAGRAALLLVVLLTLAWAYAFTRIYTRDHSRVTAAAWLVQHAPPGSVIAAEEWDDPLPLQTVNGHNPYGVIYRGFNMRPYWEDEPTKYFGRGDELGVLDQLEDADFITLTSNRIYDSTSRLPMRYPVQMRLYHYLFSGELGFELVADITSYPSIFGISIPDQWAEEAFTVYDHPRVLIFQKTANFSRERAEALLTDETNWREVYRVPLSAAERAPTALRLTESEWPRYHEGGTWAALWNPQSIVNHEAVAPLAWLLVLEALGLAMFALLFRLLPWLPDRGWSLARVLGLLLVAYAAWLLGSFKLLPFTPLTVWLCALPLLVGGAWVGWRSRAELRAFGRQRWRALLTSQAIYLGAFGLLLLIRWLNPDLWHPALGGEKPMDFAYLNAVLQSTAFPPYDPWFAGGYINYYYFGFVIMGSLTHLTGIIPAIAYNLAVPTIFALTALGSWGIVYNLLAPRARKRIAASTEPPPPEAVPTSTEPQPVATQSVIVGLEYAQEEDEPAAPPAAAAPPETLPAPRTRTRWQKVEARARLAALLAPLFVLLLGSLTQAVWFLDGYAAANAQRPEWAFWDAARIIPMTVNEFPFFTFLFGDLHAHMIVMPFSLAVVGLLVALVRRGRAEPMGRRGRLRDMLPGAAVLLLLGLLAGTLRATNTWDYPTFVGLTAATLVLLGWWRFRRELPWLPSAAGRAEWWLLVMRRGLAVIGQVALVVLAGNLLFLPFISHFATDSSGIQPWIEGLSDGLLNQMIDAERTLLGTLLRMYGLWLFVLVSAGVLLARRYVQYRLTLLAAMATPLVLAAGFLLWQRGVLGLSPVAPWLVLPLLIGGLWLAWAMRRLAPRKLLPLLWVLLALAICLGVDFVVVTGDVGRMNTVFKFGLHAWILFALASAVALPWCWRWLAAWSRTRGTAWSGVLAWGWRGAAVVLVLASLVYPLTATPARIATRYAPDLPHTLNGMAFMAHVDGNENGVGFPLIEDYQAIEWIQQNIEGTPLLLEAHLPSYRWGARIATYTGMPSLLGWEWHQIQQRNASHAGEVIFNRKDAIQLVYDTPDPALAMDLLRTYGIEYVYVGGVERALYAPQGIAKFGSLVEQEQLEPVYSSPSEQTTLYQVVAPGAPTVLTTDIAVVPPAKEMIPPLMLRQPVGELPVVDEYAWNDWASSNSWTALLTWLLALYVLPLLGLPIAVLVFGGWRDGGFVWARLIGLLLLGYAVWLPTSLGLWHYNLGAVAGGALLVLALNGGALFWLGRSHTPPTREPDTLADSEEHPADEPSPAPTARWYDTLWNGAKVLARHLKARRRAILLVEGLFVLAFLAFTGLRALNPDLWHHTWGGEKPMESGFLNAILRSPVMPPYDPFFAGGYINYYYYGIYLVSLPIKITGIDPAIAYNLLIPTVFALTLSGAYALVAQLTGRIRYGLLGAAFLALVGNLATIIPGYWARDYGRGTLANVVEGLQSVGIGELGLWLGDWYVSASRVIPNTINEFPFFTFIYADLHPHMLALPVVLLTIALAYQYVLRSGERARAASHLVQPLPLAPAALPLYLLIALALGTLAVTNSWDFPTYTLLVGAAIIGMAWRTYRGPGLPWRALVRSAALTVGLSVGGMALYLPFFDHFYAMVSGVGLVWTLEDGTSLDEYVIIYGLFLAIVLPFVLGVAWRLLTLAGRRRQQRGRAKRLVPLLFVVVPLVLAVLATAQPVLALTGGLLLLLLLGVGLALQRRLSDTPWFVVVLVLLAWAVSLGIELIFIRDHLAITEFYRMNTVFKFGLQIWTLLALAAAASLPYLLRGVGRLGPRLGTARWVPQAATLLLLGVLLLGALVFPLVGTASRLANRFDTSMAPTLDGLAFLQDARFGYDCRTLGGCWPGQGIIEIDLAPDAEAIEWLNEHLSGTPVVVQSNLEFYRTYGIRVAANTGFPTITSQLHVNEQRDPQQALLRDLDVERLYRTTDIDTTLRLLARYQVDYVYVGPVERAFYAGAGLQKFADMAGTYLDIVYENPGVQIYRVAAIPPAYMLPAPVAFDDAPQGPAAPVPLPGEEAPALDPEPLESGDELAQLESQVAREPTNSQLVYGLAERYRNLNQLDDADRVLAVAAAANPEDVGLHHLWGDILAQAGRYDDAERVYRQIAEAVPTAGNWNKLGTGLLDWGKLDAAEEALQRAVELEPDTAEPYFRLGQVYFREGERDKAVVALETYLELDPDGYLSAEARKLLEDLQ